MAADLDAGLRRLRLGAMRHLVPVGHREDPALAPKEFLRTLVETEIASRDASNARARLKTAAFPLRLHILNRRLTPRSADRA